jgi:hypothetical protein
MLSVSSDGRTTGCDALLRYYMLGAGVVSTDLSKLGLLATTSQAPVPTSASFQVGDSVEGRYKGSPNWYPARITAVHAGPAYALYDLLYEDGDREDRVKDLRVKKPGMKQKKDLLVGARIEARFKGGQQLFDGVVSAVNGDGTFTITYEDGDIEKSVPRNFISAEWH